ncbi:hypothetical protein [Nonomuraea ceibae]|uniref:hypothetical protein n=1 Tax=Nonomuraea ceibae TaxID=1935170 RepID=UPI001C5D75FC|nr:hypothetical protein [Nonomuraea ceibae]
MYSERKPLRRFLLFVLIGFALVFVVRQPDKAAIATTHAFNGLMAVADALASFAGNLG